MADALPDWTFEYLDALQRTQSPVKAALLLGLARSTVQRAIADNPTLSRMVDDVRRLSESDFWIADFLERLSTTGLVHQSAREAGVSGFTVLRRARMDPEFAELYEDAKALAADRLEAVAHRRAVEGEDEPLVAQGRIVPRQVAVLGDDGQPLYVTLPNQTERVAVLQDVLDDQGRPVPGTIKVADNKLLAKLLDGHKPERFRIQKHEVSGPNGAPVATTVTVVTGVPQPSTMPAGLEDIA